MNPLPLAVRPIPLGYPILETDHPDRKSAAPDSQPRLPPRSPAGISNGYYCGRGLIGIMLIGTSIMILRSAVRRIFLGRSSAKDYAYIIVIPSILFAIEHFEILVPRWILFVLLVLVSCYTMPPVFQIFSLLSAVCCFVFFGICICVSSSSDCFSRTQ